MLLPDATPGQANGEGDTSNGPSPIWHSRRGRRWLAAVGAIAALGVAASVVLALVWHGSVRTRERGAFETSATNVGGTLATLLRRDTDFVRSVRAVLTLNPAITAGAFREWSRQLEDHQAALGAYGALVVKSVPAARLQSFQAQRNGEAAFRELVGGHIEHVGDSGRAHYCLLGGGSANIGYNAEVALVLQGDWCDPNSLIGGYRQNGTTRARFTETVTSSGQFLAYSASLPGGKTLILEGAYYRRGVPLATGAERRANVLGWVLGSFEIPTLLSSALHGYRGLSVTLQHFDPGQSKPELIGHAGTSAHAAFTARSSFDANGKWIVTVSGAALASGPSALVQALAVLIGGLIATALLSALLLVLARGREAALAMVEEKTGQLRHQALHDALTGLPNRVLALDRAEQMLARARRQERAIAALYVDVDGFKDVNDSFGHAAGDELLRIVAARLQSVVRGGDTAARLGGDEFVILVEGSTLDAGPELVAERLLEVLRQPYDMREHTGRELTLTASIGIAFGLRGSAGELLRDADVALYQAKAAGRNRHVLFRADMQSAVQDRLTTQMELLEALARDELFLLYKPTFDLQSGRVAGVEALVRWQHPTRGVLAPREFLPIAESSGLIVALGGWVLAQACRQIAGWRARGLHASVSVNVSARQLAAEELVGQVADALRDSGLEPAALTLEINEAALLADPHGTGARLRALKALGVHITIDDFASGYSALTSVHAFPADALKLDRAFVNRLASSTDKAALLETFVRLGRTLAIDTLAEGIEDSSSLADAQHEQCEHEHGFLFSRPLDAEDAEAFLRAGQPAGQPQPTR